jgi:uncharacterized protein YndB with AHSA1/START domain
VNQTIRPAPIRKQLILRATPETAFRVFTEGFHRWWPKSHQIGGAPMAKAVLEPRVGGRWYEVGEDGSECDWGEVLAWEPPRRVLLAWRINAGWTHDANAHSEVEAIFTPAGEGETRLDFEHRGLEGLGEGAEALRAQLDGGWSPILDGYKAVAES